MSGLFMLISTSMALAGDAAATKPLLQKMWDFFGVFHPATVHFPIGLLSAAAMFIVLRWKFKAISEDVPFYCLLIGTAGAFGATAMGWAFAPYQGYGDMFAAPDKEVFWHRWSGVIVCVLALIATVMAIKARAKFRATGKPSHAWQIVTLLSAALVGWVGHQGGEMTYGHDFYTKPWADPVVADDPPATDMPPADSKVDFAKHIAPIFEKHCVSCHGEKKAKAKLTLHTKKSAFESGDSAPDNIIPGDSKASYLVEVIELPDDSDELMPPKKEGGPLPKATIDLIKRWIDEGATWPEGLNLKGE